MSEDKSFGQQVLSWWSVNIGARDNPRARALAARLRRAEPVEALAERPVQELARALSIGPAQAAKLASLVQLLAEVREHDGRSLAQCCAETLSELRFQRLIRAEGEEFTGALRRAISMVDRRCNVAALATDIWHWNEQTRIRWCFHYFGANAPTDELKEKTE